MQLYRCDLCLQERTRNKAPGAAVSLFMKTLLLLVSATLILSAAVTMKGEEGIREGKLKLKLKRQ